METVFVLSAMFLIGVALSATARNASLAGAIAWTIAAFAFSWFAIPVAVAIGIANRDEDDMND